MKNLLSRILKRPLPLIVAGVALCISAIILLMWYVVTGVGRQASVAAQSEQPSATSTEPEAPQLVSRLLDGVMVAPNVAKLEPFAVMVENSPDARPLSGPAKANVVIEAPVEGGITRFMLLFDASSTVDQIGPVRSARPYYVDFADSLKAVYAHVGGSPEALSKIQSLAGFKNLDEFANAKYFWRSAKRYAPHNAYTRTDLLLTAFAAHDWQPVEFQPWRYEAAATSTSEVIQLVNVPYGGTFNVTWKYDPSTNLYSRYQAGIQQKDADGEAVKASNVVVMQSDASVLDNEGRLRVRTTGSGQAELFRDGKKFQIEWHRLAGEWLRFETAEGADVMFQPGKTWISLVTTSTMMP